MQSSLWESGFMQRELCHEEKLEGEPPSNKVINRSITRYDLSVHRSF